MDDFIERSLPELRANYEQVRGSAFQHFFCPMLYCDEDTELCAGHIVNDAFQDSDTTRIVQRKDVDNFYGRYFEADFVAMQRLKGKSPVDILVSGVDSRSIKTAFLVENKRVEHFFTKKSIPPQFTELVIPDAELDFALGIKIHPRDLPELKKKKWEVEAIADVRVQVLVSLIKAAHLTLFSMLGYGYVFSATGQDMAKNIIGKFYLQCRMMKSKIEILAAARDFFAPYIHMVRPVVSSDADFTGTVSDRLTMMCIGTSGAPWGQIVYVRTAGTLWAVLMPIFDTTDSIDTYFSFMKNSVEVIRTAVCRFEFDKWLRNPDTHETVWNKNATLA